MKRFILFGVVIGLVAGIVKLWNEQAQVSVHTTHPAGVVEIRSADNTSPNDQTKSGGVDRIGAAILGPKQGDVDHNVQVPSGGIDQIIGDREIEIK